MKKAIYTLIAIAVLSDLPGSANAGQINEGPSCEQWVKDPGDFLHGNNLWLLGYLTGLARDFNKDFISGAFNPEITRWVDNYCHDHPLMDVEDVGKELAKAWIIQKGL